MLMIDDNFAGRLLNLTGKPDDALAAYRDGLAIARELAAKPGADATARNDLAISLSQIGLQLSQAKDFAGADENLAEAMTIAMGLMTEAPTNPLRARYAALIARNLGMDEAFPRRSRRRPASLRRRARRRQGGAGAQSRQPRRRR